jgi:hypothetical protein
MAKAKFDIKTLELPPVAAKPLYAGVGVTDLAVEIVRDYVADVQKKLVGYQKDVQKSVTGFEFEPKALRKQAVTVVNARRAAVEARVAELQADAQALPTKVQSAVNENVTTLTDTYGDLVKRGEVLVTRIRKQESTKATKSSAKTTTAKAKTTNTQATKATRSTAKKATTTAKKSSGPARSSAKATVTAAKKTASSAAQATTDAAEKVGD